MKKIFLILSIFLIVSYIYAGNPEGFEEFLREIQRQSEKISAVGDSDNLEARWDSRDYQVGDQEVFWSWALNVMPPEWILTPATCRAVGEHCYLFVADEEWNSNMDQSDVDEIMPYLEDHTMNSTEYGAVEMDIINFGPIPDELDNDPKVIVFYMELGSYAGSTFDGYFSAYNQVTEAQAQTMNPPGHSNECEMIYMTCYPLQPNDPIRISVLSHELQHLIHWGADINESTWVNEGCSELAMVLFGLPDPITGFPTNPDNSLISWEQTFADYVKTMLFFTYLSEHFDDGSLIADIVSDPANSISGIQNQLIAHGYQIPFEAIFTNWVIANYLDDPEIGAGQYNYELLDIPQFTHSAYISSFPNSGSGTVNAWAADYLKLTTNGLEAGSSLSLTIEPGHGFSFAALYYSDNTTFSHMETLPVDDNFTLELISSEEDFYKVILVVSNNTNTSLSYSYELEIEGVSVDEALDYDQPSSVSVYPNPVSGSMNQVNFYLENTGENNSVELYNIKGQKIMELPDRADENIIWNLKDNTSRPVANGIYLYRLKGSNPNKMKKLLILK